MLLQDDLDEEQEKMFFVEQKLEREEREKERKKAWAEDKASTTPLP